MTAWVIKCGEDHVHLPTDSEIKVPVDGDALRFEDPEGRLVALFAPGKWAAALNYDLWRPDNRQGC